MSTGKRYRDAAVVVALLTVPFFFLRASVRKPESLGPIDRTLLRIAAPVQYAAATVTRGISGVVRDYMYLVDVKQDNERLTYENARLAETARKLERHRAENQELRRLVQLKESVHNETLSAQVVSRGFSDFFRVTSVVLDRGSRDVRVHMPVISPSGVVGSVEQVTGDSANVRLAVDAAFGVDVEDERTGARAFVRGRGDPKLYSCRVEMVDFVDEVQVGDLLITSGKGRWFPKGIPVARVTRVVKREMGRDQEVDAIPTVDFSRLDTVLIVATPPAEDELGKGH